MIKAEKDPNNYHVEMPKVAFNWHWQAVCLETNFYYSPAYISKKITKIFLNLFYKQCNATLGINLIYAEFIAH